MNHSPSEGRGVEAAARGLQNCLTQVTISSTATHREHTCAVNSIVSGYFLLGTCPWSPQLHGWGHPASYGTPVKCNRTLGTASPEAEFPSCLHRLSLQPSMGADIQSLRWLKDNWQLFPRWEYLMVTPAAVRMRVTAFSFLACPQEGSQTHWTGAGFPPLPSGWQNFPNSFVQIPKRKDPTQGEGKNNFTGMKLPVKWIMGMPPSHLCSHTRSLLSIYFLLWKLAASN